MNIFVTGATGYIGSAVTADLIAAGHRVTGLARSDAAAARLAAAGAGVHRGDLDDLDRLGAGAAAADGVIHTAFTNVSATTDFAASSRADLRAVTALGEALAGSGRPLVIASGTGFLAPGVVAAEDAPYDPQWPAELRVASELAVLALAAPDAERPDAERPGPGRPGPGRPGSGRERVRAVVLRLPFSVHGEGDARGFVSELIAIARQQGFAGYPGDGANRWPAVHRGDAARLFRLAAESAPAGSRLHAVGDQGVPFREIATAIGRHLGLPVRSVPAGEAGGYFGFLAPFAVKDGPASGAATERLLGWRPQGPGLIEDIGAGHYFRQG